LFGLNSGENARVKNMFGNNLNDFFPFEMFRSNSSVITTLNDDLEGGSLLVTSSLARFSPKRVNKSLFDKARGATSGMNVVSAFRRMSERIFCEDRPKSRNLRSHQVNFESS
jgi:hypothetical protein